MADYTQTTFFATKDNLASGDAAKVIKGSEVDAELLAIKNAVNSKTETGDVPSGSAMLFMQASAPVGWQQVTTHNDKALRVVSGTGNGTGGSVAFETAFASKSVTGSIGGNTANHQLTLDEIPAHTHTVSYASNDAEGVARNGSGGASGTFTSGSAGGNVAHRHGASGLTFTGTAINLDVQFVDVIVCTKD